MSLSRLFSLSSLSSPCSVRTAAEHPAPHRTCGSADSYCRVSRPCFFPLRPTLLTLLALAEFSSRTRSCSSKTWVCSVCASPNSSSSLLLTRECEGLPTNGRAHSSSFAGHSARIASIRHEQLRTASSLLTGSPRIPRPLVSDAFTSNEVVADPSLAPAVEAAKIAVSQLLKAILAQTYGPPSPLDFPPSTVPVPTTSHLSTSQEGGSASSRKSNKREHCGANSKGKRVRFAES